jgi:hypothetical protein
MLKLDPILGVTTLIIHDTYSICCISVFKYESMKINNIDSIHEYM